ncbi:hypothetical protein GE21DRAFT_8353 [Neurospora crassa]|uniref:G-patch DNA repair protein n=1 Tax=Neurospora crassa (strain ATCC 24698 / 74-OR23-1A / CBS 708.71 / DSM 1257 / FGSC 987) TaxID=367110 RepID=Q7S7F5_NEUCR|nr:G-patch DNA repair protein [Neurospora crassa OR74A]EAA31573.2 G-patch DNA repair protein [Neurospora crassa OR74A]KHE78902.1 hypothetical protein GE21DRAFT_8353 [Neurospora crassa]|eukprot:XP_960809.2 G-patch DNA repair protein [Neurospora crassa OR74A]
MSGPPPARGGLSLYANLLDPSGTSDSTSASNDAVANKQDDAPAKKAVNPAFAFQPIRRPQVKQANKPKPTLPKAPPSISIAAVAATVKTSEPENNGTTDVTTTSTAYIAAPQQRSTLADWVATEDDEYLYSGSNNRRERGGRRKKKKKNDDRQVETNWDELYDPARPTNVEEYLRSDERIREIRDWKAVLYAHRRKRRDSFDSRRSDEDEEEEDRRVMNNQFAPPVSFSFAPPPMSPPRATTTTTSAPVPAVSIPVDESADEAYARRLALSGMAPPPPQPQPPAAEPSVPDTATISRAPVRYEAPPQPPSAPDGSGHDAMDLDSDDEDVNYDSIPVPLGTGSASPAPEDADAPKSKLPGQAGFAARLMSKYGWTAGSGLGASESGITTALQVKVEKRKKRSDAEGGGWAEPGGRGKIIAGKPAAGSSSKGEEQDGGKFGKMSEVIVLDHMLDGMSDEELRQEVEGGDLYEEIGTECGEKYGRVMRLFVETEGRRVFIRFTDGVSALRAVNALEGRIFNGNAIVPRFYDLEKFEAGVYK